MRIKVLVVDDSALMRQLLTALFARDPELEVVGAAADPLIAREMIKATSPDVITLDIEMPRMDGLTFLRNLMRLRPTPVVMVSSLTERGADATLAALALGAIDFVAKPKLQTQEALGELAETLVAKVKVAARARPAALLDPPPVPQLRTTHVGAPSDRVIAIGASTGGTEAIASVLRDLPPSSPAIVITQHIPAEFSRRFAARLHETTQLTVSEAVHGASLMTGHAYVAPGGRHLRIVRSGARYLCDVSDDEPVNRHRPSVDVLFASVATHARARAIGVLLTGMGADGADGLLAMRAAGARTIVQDRETSVVWGMPGEAFKRGAAEHVVPLSAIAKTLA